MSKKNKNKDIWDLTPEEQMEYADNLYDIEVGASEAADIFSFVPPHQAIDENGLSAGIEAAILSDIKGDKSDNDHTNDISDIRPITFETFGPDFGKNYLQPIEFHKDTESIPVINEEHLSIAPLPQISFRYIEDIDRIIIADGVINTVFNTYAAADNIIGAYDNDDKEDKIDLFITYIISLRFPAAIYTEDEFLDRFTFVADYDEEKFYFFSYKDYILAYILDNDSFVQIISEIESLTNGDINNILRYWIGMSYSAGTLNQVFMMQDENAFNKYMNSIDGNKDLFSQIFMEDDETVIIEDDESDEQKISIVELDRLQILARKTIVHMTGDDIDEDEEDLLSSTESDDSNYDVINDQNKIPDDFPDDDVDGDIKTKLEEIDKSNNNTNMDELMDDVEVSVSDEGNLIPDDEQILDTKSVDTIGPSEDDNMIIKPIMKKK